MPFSIRVIHRLMRRDPIHVVPRKLQIFASYDNEFLVPRKRLEKFVNMSIDGDVCETLAITRHVERLDYIADSSTFDSIQPGFLTRADSINSHKDLVLSGNNVALRRTILATLMKP